MASRLGSGEPDIYEWMMVGDYFTSEDDAIAHCKRLYDQHSEKVVFEIG